MTTRPKIVQPDDLPLGVLVQLKCQLARALNIHVTSQRLQGLVHTLLTVQTISSPTLRFNTLKQENTNIPVPELYLLASTQVRDIIRDAVRQHEIDWAHSTGLDVLANSLIGVSVTVPTYTLKGTVVKPDLGHEHLTQRAYVRVQGELITKTVAIELCYPT